MPDKPSSVKPEAPEAIRMFRKIPGLIKRKGRVAGFEAMRDMSLGEWEVLSAKMNPYSALKLAIEFDRHAMFAEVASEKAKGSFDRSLWDSFQDYLHGKVESVPDMSNQGMLHNPPPPPASSGDGVEDNEEEEEDGGQS